MRVCNWDAVQRTLDRPVNDQTVHGDEKRKRRRRWW